jgi:hypothetical protein
VLVPQGPARQGFTWSLSLGIGLINVSPDGAPSESRFGLGGLDLAVGGFVNENLAIIFKASGATVFEDGATITVAIGAGAIQFWFGDSFRLEAGLGLHITRVEAGGFGFEGNAPGIYLSPGFQISEWGFGNSLQLAIEYAGGFYDGGRIDAVGFVLAYQGF